MILVYDGFEQKSFHDPIEALECFEFMSERRKSGHVRMRLSGRAWLLRDFQGTNHSVHCWCLKDRPYGELELPLRTPTIRKGRRAKVP